jgi:hypothetical protein
MTRAVDSGDNINRGPSRTEFMVTTQGKAEFESLLESALKSNDIQLFAVGIAFMEMLPRQNVISLLKERHSSLKEVAKESTTVLSMEDNGAMSMLT